MAIHLVTEGNNKNMRQHCFSKSWVVNSIQISNCNLQKGKIKKISITQNCLYNSNTSTEARKTDETGQTFKLHNNAYLA
jgi:hypothetical protein